MNALADLVLVCHLGFILFAVGGALLALRWPRVLWIHAPAALWAVLVELQGWVCPLTPLEGALREAAGERAREGDFVVRHLLPVVYPPGLTREVQVALGGAVLVTNAGLYGLVWRRHRMGRKQAMGTEHWSPERDGPFSEAALRRKLESRGYSVTRYVYPPGTRFEEHTHAIDKMDAVLSGRFRLVIEGREAVLGPGDAIAVPRGALHSAEVVGDEPVVSLDATKE